jgi:FLVCR family feline leukemia virus subgroup C receptor-related protein
MRKFKLPIAVSSIVGLGAFGLITGVLFTHNFALLAISVCVLAFVISPSGPLSGEFACELTFPVGEGTTAGVRLGLMQIVCPAQAFAIGAIMGMENKQRAAVYSFLMLCGFMLVGFISSLFITENLARSKHDKEHMDKANAEHAAANNPETPCKMLENPENPENFENAAENAEKPEEPAIQDNPSPPITNL